jgi:hypothetical protein
VLDDMLQHPPADVLAYLKQAFQSAQPPPPPPPPLPPSA